MNNINTLISELFLRYIDAFESFDIAKAASCYTLPCMLVTGDQLILVQDGAQLATEFNNIFAGLKQANFARVGWQQATIQSYNEASASVIVPWHFYDQDNKPFASFSGIYQLVKVRESDETEHWKIAQVTSHFETARFKDSINFSIN